MGIMDNASNLFDKGVEVASNLADMAGELGGRAKIKAQLVDQGFEYDHLMKKLGEAVYEQIKDDASYTQVHPDLFKSIEECAARKQDLLDQLSELEADTDSKRPIDVEPIAPEGAETTIPEDAE